MEDTSFLLGNGLRIDADNPETHGKPGFCKECKVFYYFAGHFCTENMPGKAFKRAIQGYYDGE